MIAATDTLPTAGDDAVVPFQVDTLDARGRAVQLSSVLDGILGRHNYPEPVAKLVAEMVVMAVILGTSLKFDGKFILQTKSDGPVELLVADFRTPDAVRAYARFDEARLAEAVAQGKDSPEELLGMGILAMTVDQGEFTQRYQGIVQLDGSSLEEVAKTYFRQSEQIPTDVRLATARLMERSENGEIKSSWRAGGIISQFLPESSDRMRTPDLHGGDGDDGSSEFAFDDSWTEVQALMATIKPDELVDPQVSVELLLYRLFNERGVRAYPPTRVFDKCACSREHIRSVLVGFTAEEIKDSVEDGKISVECEFCSTTYVFDPDEFAKT
ncbi:MAG: Hsp33 family molecular chaperone [Rhizobiaceae bacterium]